MKKNELKIGAILSYVSLFISNIISIIYTPIMLKFLGKSEYGLLTLANSIIGYFGVLDFGFGNAIIRYISKYKNEEDKNIEYNINGMFLIIYSIISFIAIIAGFIVVQNIDLIFKSLHTAEQDKIKLLIMVMIFNMAISLPATIFSAILSAYERFTFQKILGILRSILNPFLTLPLLFMGYKSIAITIISTILNIAFILCNIYYCFRVLDIKIRFDNIDLTLFKEIFSYSYFIFLNIVVDKIYWSTDQLILGAVVGANAVAIYNIGSMFNVYYKSISTAISGVFLPRITSMVVNKVSDEDLSDLFIRIGRIQYIILSFILTGFILIGKEFIYLWVGEGYEDTYYIALTVMIPLTIPLIQNLGISILQAKNMHKFRSKLYICVAIVNLILSIPMAKVMGGIGCSLMSGICFLVANGIVMNFYYYQKIKLDIPRFWNNILMISKSVIGSLLVSFFIISSIKPYGYFYLLIKGIIFTIIFGVSVWFKALNGYEKDLINDIVSKFYKRRNKYD